MRIRLQKGKQEELILKAKKAQTWRDLAKILEINTHYLATELKKENKLISDETYKKLNYLINENYDSYILEKLNDNWGRSRGGRKSKGNLKEVWKPERGEELAEFLGIMLGDGNLTKLKKYKIGVYQIRVVGDSRNDRDYLLNFVKPLIERLFKIKVAIYQSPNKNAINLTATGKKLIEFLEYSGLKPGNKLKSQVTIPAWINQNPKFLQACLRGLIDTDGGVNNMSNKDPKLARISFTNHNKQLLKDTREGFIKLGFSPSQITIGKRFYISKQKEMQKYLKEVGFSNPKHARRMYAIKNSLVV